MVLAEPRTDGLRGTASAAGSSGTPQTGAAHGGTGQ